MELTAQNTLTLRTLAASRGWRLVTEIAQEVIGTMIEDACAESDPTISDARWREAKAAKKFWAGLSGNILSCADIDFSEPDSTTPGNMFKVYDPQITE